MDTNSHQSKKDNIAEIKKEMDRLGVELSGLQEMVKVMQTRFDHIENILSGSSSVSAAPSSAGGGGEDEKS